MKYPLRTDYDQALRNISQCVFDSSLKTGKPVMQTNNSRFFRSYNGGKATVYEIQTPTKKYALKCWIEDLGDLKSRYQEINDYLQQCQLPYFADFYYNKEGVLVNGSKYPIVRMEWIDGISFKKFITNNINNPVHICEFAKKFLEMVQALHQHNISHGDLQHGNIMVRHNGQVCLIDYDSLYVPNLHNEKDNIKGLPGYQHPNRNNLSKLSPKSDYFSELVIYLSLLAIAERPSYWQCIEPEERLLFSHTDLAKPHSSQIFSDLKKLSPEIQYFTTELEKFCQEQDIENLQPLENLVSVYAGPKISWDFPPPPPIDIGLNNPPTQPKNVSPTNIWDNIDTAQTANKAIWDKLEANSPWDKLITNKDNWDELEGNSDWNKLDTYKTTNKDIWNKLVKSVSSICSSIWDRVVQWFTT